MQVLHIKFVVTHRKFGYYVLYVGDISNKFLQIKYRNHRFS